MVIINLYLTFLILIILHSKEGIYPLVRWIFPICNIVYLQNHDFSDLGFLCDILIHSIFITSYLWSIDIVKIFIL